MKQVQEFIDRLVHPSARHQAALAACHRGFISIRLIGGVALTATLPLYLALHGAPSALAGIVGGAILAQFAIACLLAHTGRYEVAQVASACVFTAALVAGAAMTGGLLSPLAPLLMLTPLEAMLCASRRTAVTVSLVAGCGLILLSAPYAAGSSLGLPDATPWSFAFSTGVGLLLAALLAGRMEFLGRVSAAAHDRDAERFRLLASNMTDVIATHGARGMTKFVSPGAQALFGVPAQDLLAYGIFDRVHVADRPAYLRTLADAASGEAMALEFRMRRTLANGAGAGADFIWVEMRARAVESPASDGEAEVVAVLRDVSERKRQEFALAQTRSEAERANAAKGHFLATTSHELRTPLNSVLGFSEMLMQEKELQLDAARRHEYARLIHESGQHLLSVVNLVLDMSKLEAGSFAVSPEPFIPASVIRNCCDLLALKAADAGVSISVRVPEVLPEIVSDSRALKQIMLNLLSNAIKFTPRGGAVTVNAQARNDEILLCVSDTGVGISADDLPRIGHPFFQAQSGYDRRYEGTGLGLSIVKGLLELLGGRMEVASQVGAGTQITVHLPLDSERHGARGRVVALAGARESVAARPERETEVRRSA